MQREPYHHFPLEAQSEEIIRPFLFERADRVRLTRAEWGELRFTWPFYIKKGMETDLAFVGIMALLQPHLLKTEVTNTRYPDRAQGKYSKFHHDHFALSDAVKHMLTENTLRRFPPGGVLYGFEDPTFYAGEEILATVISHERSILLYLTEEERRFLEQQGVVLEHVEQ